MKLSMLFATYGDRVKQLSRSLPKPDPRMEIIIVHQGSDYDFSAAFTSREDVLYIQSNELGVTKSRNLALHMAKNDIVLFCDDDVNYQENIVDIVLSAYQKNCTADAITFQTTRGQKFMPRRFESEKFRHTYFSILKVGTIELSAKLSIIQRENIMFPEDMGAGAKYYLCDEPVFISKIMKAGGNAFYTPEVIGDHPEDSSGSSLNNMMALKSRLLCFRRIFGYPYGTFLYYAFVVKNYKRIHINFILKAAFLVYFY